MQNIDGELQVSLLGIDIRICKEMSGISYSFGLFPEQPQTWDQD